LLEKTNNIYIFSYLLTSITGKGIPHIYLPEVPPKEEILDFNGRWIKQELPSDWEEWKEKEEFENFKIKAHNEKQRARMEKGLEYLPLQDEYLHDKIEAFKEQEWIRRINGVWFYNTVNGVKTPTYITGLHYFLLQWWPVPFEVEYRDTDREIGYWIQYWEEDPYAIGGLLGMMRQYGKSVWLGCWGFERTSRTKNAHLGMQGENDKKISSFYEKNILYPFDRLIDFFTPQYYKAGQNKESIEFVATKKRNTRLSREDMDKFINSKIDYGIADINRYNGETLHGYIGEESGKVIDVDIYERHRKVVPAMRRRKGKMFYASTSDEINPKAKSFRQLVYDSDFGKKKENGETKSGLLFAFIPSQHAHHPTMGINPFDEFGIPLSERNLKAILDNRKSYEDNPAYYTMLCRQNPITIDEYFYADANKCLFNVRVIQEARNRCYENPNITGMVDFVWEGGKEFGKIMTIPGDTCTITSIIHDPEERNLILDRGAEFGPYRYFPMNDKKYVMGLDPIQHKIIPGDTGRKSKPIAFVKRRYDNEVDGIPPEGVPWTLYKAVRAGYAPDPVTGIKQKYMYKTGIPTLRYDYRPNDPVVFYENILKICWYYGIKVLVELQYGAGLISYFEEKGCAAFIMKRPDITRTSKRYNQETDGVSASTGTTQIFTSLIAHDVEYYGHMYPFIELLDDLLKFDPYDTLEFDDSVAWGLTLLAEQDKVVESKPVDISMGAFSRFSVPQGSASEWSDDDF
jgi:hypothetical protein